jgi:hypothetical protein
MHCTFLISTLIGMRATPALAASPADGAAFPEPAIAKPFPQQNDGNSRYHKEN